MSLSVLEPMCASPAQVGTRKYPPPKQEEDTYRIMVRLDPQECEGKIGTAKAAGGCCRKQNWRSRRGEAESNVRGE